MKRVASDWEVAGRADETGHVPGLFQGIHDLLWRKDIKLNTFLNHFCIYHDKMN